MSICFAHKLYQPAWLGVGFESGSASKENKFVNETKGTRPSVPTWLHTKLGHLVTNIYTHDKHKNSFISYAC